MHARSPVTESHALVPDNELAKHVRSSLEAANLRYTGQRGSVYAFLAQSDGHPAADEVYRAVQQAWPKISLATVYNALDALVEAGLVTKLVSGESPARYDCRGEDHYHLRDIETGEIRDLPVEFDPTLLEKLAPQLVDELAANGFHVTGYRLEVLGKFDRC